MSFCPSCGAQNTDDARFCNKCGAAIAAVSAATPPTRPVAPAPVPAPNTTTITLAGIGIQSPGRTYAILGVGALVFLGLGGVIAYVGMHSGGTATAAATQTSGDGSDGSGDALPDGVDVPEDDFVMTSGAHVVKRGPSAPGGGTTSTGTETTGGGTTPPSSGTAAHATTGTGTTAHTTTGTGTTAHTTTGTHTGTTGTDPTPPSTGTSPSTGTPPGSSVDWGTMEGTVADPADEPDYQMQMYSTQVRRFMRQYLLPQAQSCFEHASATSRDPIHGTVAIGFDIDARGHAQGASVDRNTTGLDNLARCLQNNVNSWQLPPPPADTAPIAMQIPFTR